MNKIFNIKRTKMVDEAAFNHKPTMLGRSILCFFIVFTIAYIASNLLTNIPILYQAFYTYEGETAPSSEELMSIILEMTIDSLPWWISLLMLFSRSFFIVAPIVFCLKFEKRSVSSMGIRKRGIPLELLIGLGIGGAMALITFLVNYLVGSLSFTFNGFSPIILLYFVGFIIASLGEELLVRGYFMTSLARDMPPIGAIIISALLFALFNLSVFNLLSILNTFLFGIFLGIFVFKRGSIWGSFTIKLVWGFVSACILGTPAYYFPMPSLFTATYSGAQIVSGDSTLGLSSGIVLTVILIALIGISLLLKTKKSEESQINIDYFK